MNFSAAGGGFFIGDGWWRAEVVGSDGRRWIRLAACGSARWIVVSHGRRWIPLVEADGG